MTTTPRKMMGLESPGDQRVALPVRTWNALKLALWRNKGGWEIAAREAESVLAKCRHRVGCEGIVSEDAPCLSDRYEKQPKAEDEDDEAYERRQGILIEEGCPDRELRMSALVILNAARTCFPADARKPANEPYSAPSREYFSEVMAELLATQAELEELRASRAPAVTVPDAQMLPPPLQLSPTKEVP